MKKILIACSLFTSLLLISGKSFADKLSPSGLWYNISDEGENKGEKTSHIQIWTKDDVAYGKIVKLLLKSQDTKCDKCKGDRYMKPIVGMIILTDLKYDADNDEWSGGKIYDPNNGKWYKCYIKVLENGDKLKVRGFIGFSLLGRTQYWYKIQ